MATWSTFRDAGSSLLARRRAQRGFPTFGDEADRDFVEALAGLPPAARDLARETGLQLGTDVYSRRYHEDTLPKGVEVLAQALHESGLGALALDGAFHRSARLRFAPAQALASAAPDVREAFLEGLLEGYLSQAFNSHAAARASSGGILEIDLGAGRDVNERRRSRA